MGLTQFLSALAAIVVIDLVLAGDNAIVIALAARKLPPHLQKRAIIWGAVGAIGVRSALTVAVVWLLTIPGLLLAGGVLLLWIAYRLLVPEGNGDGETNVKGAATFWAAMRTIIVADAIMGLDNVLAVAGAAHGSYLLVVLGLAISVPIVIWGSTLVLKLVERYPAVVYLGAAVLVITAVKMIRGEALLETWLAENVVSGWLLYLLVPLVLALGLRLNHRRRAARIEARVAEMAPQLPPRTHDAPAPAPALPALAEQTPRAPLRVLLPVDGSRNALMAVRHVVDGYRRDHALEVVLLNVQAPLSRHIARFLARGSARQFHREQAERALRGARRLLGAHGVPFQTRVEIGDRAQVICARARTLDCHHIVLGTARRSSLTRMFEDSVTGRVLEQTSVPVEIVTGAVISSLERYGVPIGIGAGIGLLLLALD